MRNFPKHLLILTDHSKHSASNSFYTLSSAFSALKSWEKVEICSRGLKVNENFFDGKVSSFWVTPHQSGLDFSSMQGRWREHLYKKSLQDYDAVLLRLPRPVKNQFFELLESHYKAHQIVNTPSGILITGNKKFLLNFPDICPPIDWVSTAEEAIALSHKYEIVLKPAEEYGGKGILRLNKETLWSGNEILELDHLPNLFLPEGMLAMKFLKNVGKGDKRTLVVNGNIIGSTIRFPSTESWLCNVAQGGYSKIALPDKDDQKIVERIDPILREHGIILYGFDTLVNDDGRRVLSEINSLSIGGIAPLEKATGKPYSKLIAETITNYWKNL